MRKAPAGAIVALYVDLRDEVAIGDLIETRSGRTYFVLERRVQGRGKHIGRQHLRVSVLDDATRHAMAQAHMPRIHRIRWYARRRGAGVKGKGRS